MGQALVVRVVEVGILTVKQQPLPGMDGDKVPFERELLKGKVSMEKAVDVAQGLLPHTWKKNQVEVRVHNSKADRWETSFIGEGTSEVNEDLQREESAATEPTDETPGGEGGKPEKKKKLSVVQN